ncbi:MAG: LytR/AlgR family response regulator transcription factor [Tannerellaceae bacterium]
MKVLIVEDETSAYENLKDILHEIDSTIGVVANTESVARTVEWLRTNPLPDLIFMDIHLSDDSAFAIFNQIEVNTPIIFTTAYDQYAIEAFQVNSINYLMKPIKTSQVKQALEKFEKLSKASLMQYIAQMPVLAPAVKYKDKVLIPHKDKLVPVTLTDVSFIYTADKSTAVYLNTGHSLPYAKTLEQIMVMLNPQDFFRANKQYIINRESVTDITIWFDSRLLITLNTPVPERIYVSKNKAAEFKAWMINDY